jgi:hypothetical protein
MAPVGTKLPYRSNGPVSRAEGRAEIFCSQRAFLSLTPSGLRPFRENAIKYRHDFSVLDEALLYSCASF